ncbi:MAG: hypothetical protein H8D94_01455 [Candidatus Pelagibacter sp.]|nr:hypothetical protein [Candidatus Pelagibacter sp.]
MKKVIITILIGLFIVGCDEYQGRAISRITGDVLSLQLPEDFSVPVSFASGREGEKDLFYVTMNGDYKVKTYTDWGVLESEILFIRKGN